MGAECGIVKRKRSYDSSLTLSPFISVCLSHTTEALTPFENKDNRIFIKKCHAYSFMPIHHSSLRYAGTATHTFKDHLNMFPDFFRMDTFIDSTHMKL